MYTPSTLPVHSRALRPTPCMCFLSLCFSEPQEEHLAQTAQEGHPEMPRQGVNPLVVTFQPREERAIE